MNPTLTARDAIAVLAHRALLRAKPRDPDAWYATTLKDLRSRLWDDAVAIAKDQPDLDAETLANTLDPGSTTHTPEPTSTQPEPYQPDPWTPPDPDDVAHAKARIAAIRADLNRESA